MSTPHQAASEWLLSLHKLGIKFGLSNMRAMCARSGHPERAFPCVHIAGTNGKGSTAAFLAAITGAAGLKVGLTTSPHLARLNERIVVAGRPISGRELAREVAELQAMLTALNAARPEAAPFAPPSSRPRFSWPSAISPGSASIWRSSKQDWAGGSTPRMSCSPFWR